MKSVQPSLATTSHRKCMPRNYYICNVLSSIWTLERLIDLAMMPSVGGDACKLVLYTKVLPCGWNLCS